MRMGVLAILFILCGCDSSQSYGKKYEQDEDRHARLNPPGRYQMVPAPDDRVYVLDTGDGSIRLCGALGETGEQQPVGCGPAATQ